MYCKKCGQHLDNKAKFCNKCGTPTINVEGNNDEACTTTKAHLETKNIYGNYINANIGDNNKKSNINLMKILLPIGGCVAILIVCIIIASVALGGKKNKKVEITMVDTEATSTPIATQEPQETPAPTPIPTPTSVAPEETPVVADSTDNITSTVEQDNSVAKDEALQAWKAGMIAEVIQYGENYSPNDLGCQIRNLEGHWSDEPAKVKLMDVNNDGLPELLYWPTTNLSICMLYRTYAGEIEHISGESLTITPEYLAWQKNYFAGIYQFDVSTGEYNMIYSWNSGSEEEQRDNHMPPEGFDIGEESIEIQQLNDDIGWDEVTSKQKLVELIKTYEGK